MNVDKKGPDLQPVYTYMLLSAYLYDPHRGTEVTLSSVILTEHLIVCFVNWCIVFIVYFVLIG